MAHLADPGQPCRMAPGTKKQIKGAIQVETAMTLFKFHATSTEAFSQQLAGPICTVQAGPEPLEQCGKDTWTC